MTTEKYQAGVTKRAVQAAKAASQAAELLRRAAMEAAYGAQNERMSRMWQRVSREASCLAASAGGAVVEERERSFWQEKRLS